VLALVPAARHRTGTRTMTLVPDPTARRATPVVPAREAIGDRDLGHWRSRLGQALARIVIALVLAVVRFLPRAVQWSLGHIALVATLVVGGTVALLLEHAAGEVYESVVGSTGIARLDRPVLDLMVQVRSPAAAEVVTDFTNIGGKVGMPILAAVASLTLAWWWRRWTPVVLMIAAAAGSLLLTVGAKEVTARARPPMALAVPPLETSTSFPSGHTLNATVIVGVVGYLLLFRLASTRARVAVVAVTALFVVLMGLSRVYLGHHWLSDVVAAWLFGLGWLAVVVTAHRLMITLGRVEPVRSNSGRSDPAE